MPSPEDKVEMELRRVALSYPATSEHFPWGHRTIKVRDKAFVFMGQGDGKEGSKGGFFFTAKLPTSRHVALMLPFAEPTGYGLGKSGWVSASFPQGSKPPLDMLIAWLDESYRAVAPAKLVKELGDGPPSAAAAKAKVKPKPARPKAPPKPKVAKKATARARPPAKPPAKTRAAKPAAKRGAART